jgi:Cof subfamily protein (haloacid dehalogenase superfamily)
MPIKLLALDIDGTLLTSRGELTSRNRAAIDEARQIGIQVVLLTGRRFGSAYTLLHELEIDVSLISHNGALTKDTKTLETLNVHPLEIETAGNVIRTARAFGADMICCCDEPRGAGKMFIEGISENNKSLQRYLDKYRDSVVEVPDLLESVQQPPIQMMFSGRCSLMEEFAGQLQSALGEQIRLFKTRYQQADLTILDAVNTKASKGNSLAEIAKQHGVAREEVMAIGDNHNDLTMLQYAGMGILMANAEEELKQMGFTMTSSNEEDGVAKAIEKYILKPNSIVDCGLRIAD